MAKQRPVPPGGGKPANARDRQAAPARPQPAAAQPGPRRPFPGDPSDHRPIAMTARAWTVLSARAWAHHPPTSGHRLPGERSSNAIMNRATTATTTLMVMAESTAQGFALPGRL